jgi:hypothetical protein
MASKRNIEWLREELPALVEKGVLTADAAERLRGHYSEAEAAQEGRNWIGLVFSVLGALLVGAGIILLLAYNWTDMPRPVRAVLAFVPLLAGQIGAGRVIWLSRDGPASREGWGLFLALSVGACIALISQTYHLGGEFDTFLLVWMILCLPLALLLRAVLPAILCIAGFTWWAVLWQDDGGSGLWLWVLLAAVLASSMEILLKEREGQRSTLLIFAFSIAILVATGLSLAANTKAGIWGLTYMSLFSLMYVGGGLVQDRLPGARNSLRLIGALGVLGLSVALTFSPVWKELGWGDFHVASLKGVGWLSARGLPFIYALAALVVWARAFGGNRRDLCWLGAAPLVLVAGFSLRSVPASALFNLYLFTAGVAGVVIGVRERRLGRVNIGMLVLLLIITLRFFDSDIGFVAKGVVFILLGAAFLVANIMLSRRFRRSS